MTKNSSISIVVQGWKAMQSRLEYRNIFLEILQRIKLSPQSSIMNGWFATCSIDCYRIITGKQSFYNIQTTLLNHIEHSILWIQQFTSRIACIDEDEACNAPLPFLNTTKKIRSYWNTCMYFGTETGMFSSIQFSATKMG